MAVVNLNEVKENYIKIENGLKEAIIEEINRKIQKAVRNHETMVMYNFNKNETSLKQVIQTEYVKAGFKAEIAEHVDRFDHETVSYSLFVSGWAE